MNIETILTELKKERERLTIAIETLEGVGLPKAATRTRRRRGRLTAEGRRRLSESKRLWWAERKKKTAKTRK